MDNSSISLANVARSTGDNSFGPFYELQGSNVFDFTLLFEESILSILPSALLIFAIPARIAWLSRSTRKVARSPLAFHKVVFLSMFACLEVASLVVWASPSAPITRTSLAAAVLSLVDAIGLCFLSYMEHYRSIQPSAIINVYLLLTIPMDAARTRTLWIRDLDVVVAAVFTSTLSVKVLIFITEAWNKRDILLPAYSQHSPEATSGIYSKGFFWWLNPLFRVGHSKILDEKDMFPIDEQMSSVALHASINRYWIPQNKASKYALVFALTKTMAMSLGSCVLPRLCLTFFRYMQPLLINRVVKFISQPASEYTTDVGWGLTAAYGLVYIGIAISGAVYFQQANRTVTKVRGALITLIYEKTVELSVTALDESAAVTLMSNDVESICKALALVHETWASAVDVAVAIWLLQKQVGLATIGPVVVTMAVIAVSGWVSGFMGPAQQAWMGGIQTRVNVTAKMLESMKGVKMLGLTERLRGIIQGLRDREIKLSIAMRKLFVWSLILGNGSEFLAPGAAFIIFVIVAAVNGQMLDTSAAFTALSTISLLTEPIGMLVFAFPPLLAALACFNRIQVFLQSTSRQDHRILTERTVISGVVSGSSSVFESERMEAIELRNMKKPVISVSSKFAIRAMHSSFSWSLDSPTVVSDVTFEVARGSFAFVIGPIGSGKSTLLKGILGEVPSQKGLVYVDSLAAAFVDQNSWIQNGTIRENIVGVGLFDQAWFSTVVYACALDGDIARMAKRDHTAVGSAGISLSGGQKQRLALARAVYSKRDVIFMDDVFSGLDAGTEDHVFVRLFGRQGLLRKNGVTVMLVTHAVHRLSYADHIIALDTSGAIAQQGTFDQLMNTAGYVQSLNARHKSEKDSEEETNSAEDTAPVNPFEDAIVRERASEESNRMVGDLSVYKYYGASFDWLDVVVSASTLFGFAVCIGAPGLLATYWTAAVEKHGNKVNAEYLCAFLAIEVSGGVLLYIAVHVALLRIVPKSGQRLHAILLDVVVNAPLSFFAATDTGKTVNRFSQDMTLIDMELPMAFVQCAASASICLVQAVLICLSAAYFAALMPFVGLVLYFIQGYYLRTSRQIRLLDLEAKSPLFSNFVESLSGLVTIRAFGWSKDFEDKNTKLLDNSQKPYYLLFCIQRWLSLVMDLVVAGLAVALMILMVTLRERIKPGLAGLAFLNVMGFNSTLTQLIKSWTGLETSLGAISRLKSFASDTANENLAREWSPAPETWPAHGAVQFTNVEAAYTDDGAPVLHEINLSIAAGQKIGICGHSGSGKSSLIMALLRLVETTQGMITIDGVDLSSLSRGVIRSKLNAVPQEALFIKGTVRQNADPHGLASDKEIAAALERVGVWSIMAEKGGLDVDMAGEDWLSHGQRQLFCLARAILHPSKVIILDEVTANVDLQTDELMQTIIREEFKGRTIIAVAHRLNTIEDFDRIAVLSAGRIVEYGPPRELLQMENGKFRELWDA